MLRSLSKAVFLLFWACACASSGDDRPCSSATDPLACALELVEIGPLPDICLDIGGDDNVCLLGLVCSKVHVANLPSLYLPPTGYALGLADLGASCSGGWVLGDSSGTLDVVLSDFSSDFAVDFVKDVNDGGVFADEVAVLGCNVSSIDISLHFSGRDIAAVKLLNSIADTLADLLEASVSRLLCGPISKDVADALTGALVAVLNPKLEEIMSYGPSTPPVLANSVNWHDTPLEFIHMLASLFQTNSDSIQQCLATAAPTLRSEHTDLLFPDIGKILMLNGISIPIDITLPISSDASIYIESLSLSGLDTIKDLVILSPVEGSNVTLSSSVKIDTLNISLAATLTVDSYSESVTVSLSLDNSTMLLDLVLGVSQSGLDSLYLDQVVNLGCLQGLVHTLSISSLLIDVDIKQLHYIQIEGGAGPLEADVAAAAQNFIDLLVNGFPELVHDTLVGLGQGPIRSAVNKALSDRLVYLKNNVICPEHVMYDPDTPNWIRWNSSVLIKTLDLFLDTILGAEGLNSFFSCATGGTGVVKFTPRPEMLITLSGLTSFYDFSVLLPVVYEPYELYNGIGLGYCPSDETSPCTPFEIDLKFNIEDDPGDVAVSFQNIQVMLGLFLEVDLNEIYNLQFGEWSHDGCKMSTVDDMHLYDLQLSSSYSELFLLGDTNRNITTLINKFFARLTSATNIANFNDRMVNYLDNSDYVCTETVNPSTIDDDDVTKNKDKWLMYVIIGGALVTIALVTFVHYYFSIRNEKSIWHVLLSGENIIQALYPEEFEKYRFEEAMIFHKNIPLFWRMVMPIVVFGLMALIFSSNITMAVDVLLEIDIGTEVIKPPAIFSYGLGNTIKDMWNAEVYALSALVAFFSGAWPYIKLFVMLLCWVLPPGVLKLWWREQLLEWLDILGKWSILDAYVMTLLMVAFHMTVNLEEPITAIVTVKPRYGFYSFVAATMGSLVIGHVAVIVHHYIVGNKRARDTAGLAWTNTPTMNHEFSVESRQSKIKLTWGGRALVVFLILLTALLVFAGCYMKTFEVNIKGLVGYLIDMKDSSITDYSLLDVGAELPAASGVPDTFGARWIQASFYIFAFIMPLCLQVSLLLLWVCPLSLKWQQRLFFVAEVFNAWSAIDVFSVSIVAVLLEIQDFAAFIVGDSCDVINDVLAEYFDEEMQGDDKCFDVTARILPESWTTYAAAFLLMTVELPILLMCKKILEERLEVNGVLIESNFDKEKSEDPLLEPLIPEVAKLEPVTPTRKRRDHTVNTLTRIGGSSNSNCSNDEIQNNEWTASGVVVCNDGGLWDTSSSGGMSNPGEFNHTIAEDQAEMYFENSLHSGSAGEGVTAHGINRTTGKGGSGSSAGSRGVLASVDLTEVLGPNDGPYSYNSPARSREQKSGPDSSRASGLSNLLAGTPPWSQGRKNDGVSRSDSISTSSSDFDKRKTTFNRAIDTLLYLRLISEEPI